MFVPLKLKIMQTFILQSGSSPMTINLLMMVALVAVMYLFFIRPQAKKQKAQLKFLEELKKGDEVATNAGIIGKITKMDERIVTLQISQKGFIDVLKSSLSKEMTDAYNAD